MGDKSKTDFEECISHGPWGGAKGKSWIYMPKGFIKKIVIVYGNFVHGIKFYSVETESSHFGGKLGNLTDEICIDYPNEYLTSISGTVGAYEGVEVVLSLCFGTNHNHYGPYGLDYKGAPFSYSGKGVMIVGFHGHTTVSGYLGAVGIYVMPESFALGCNSTSAENSTHQSCSRIAMPRDAGPWGSSMGGQPWDDGVFSTVKKVHVHVGEFLDVIYAIQFEYVESKAKSVLSPMHGGTAGGDKMELVNLDGSDEYLIGISGFYGYVKGVEAITSITFYTNKRIHGPYGAKSGAGYAYFSSTASPGKIVGFHGWKDCFLTAIGVHMKYF